MQAIFHLGVVSNLAGRHGKAINYFEKVVAMTRGKDSLQEIREKAWLNIARIHFEKKDLQDLFHITVVFQETLKIG